MPNMKGRTDIVHCTYVRNEFNNLDLNFKILLKNHLKSDDTKTNYDSKFIIKILIPPLRS